MLKAKRWKRKWKVRREREDERKRMDDTLVLLSCYELQGVADRSGIWYMEVWRNVEQRNQMQTAKAYNKHE